MTAGDVNTITVAGRDLLLVDVGGGAETHLARESEGGGRPALQEGRPSNPPPPGAPVESPKWEDSTLCGRTWHAMAAGPDDLTPLWRSASFAPTCRGCLRIVDGWFPPHDTPAGVHLLASVVADRVTEVSSAYVTGIPGQHLEATRKAIRKALRQRGFRSSTGVQGETLAVWSDDAYEAMGEEKIRALHRGAAERFAAIVADPQPIETEPVTISWHTWVADS